MATSWGWVYSRFQRGRTTQGQHRLRYLPGQPGQPHQTRLGHRSSTSAPAPPSNPHPATFLQSQTSSMAIARLATKPGLMGSWKPDRRIPMVATAIATTEGRASRNVARFSRIPSPRSPPLLYRPLSNRVRPACGLCQPVQQAPDLPGFRALDQDSELMVAHQAAPGQVG